MNKFLAGGLLVAMLCAPAWSNESPAEANDTDNAFGLAAGAELLRLGLVLDYMVVTAALMSDPLHISTEPRRPRLPLPAHDGGSYLRSIPGFSLSRKGGTSGDPVLRGLGGSRLNILVDGMTALGGCGGRMDPPTAYVFPEAFDRIEIIKGPQSVRYGASAAGVVRFERNEPVFDQRHLSGYASATVGSFSRRDTTLEALAGGPSGYARVIGTWSEQGDYQAGDGRRVHSQYQRWSGSGVFGWRPDQHSLLELSLERSDAEAAYDDRGMDGSRFDRTGIAVRALRRDLGAYVDEIELRLFYHYIDHVMDNFTLRQPPMMPMVSYPDRRTHGYRLAAELFPNELWQISVGTDGLDDRHRSNQIRGMGAFSFRDLPRNENIEFRQQGVFTEAARSLSERDTLTLGARIDRTRAEVLDEDGFGAASFGRIDRSNEFSAFARHSHELESHPLVLYAGLGRAERAADFWERRRDFSLSSEVLTQFDAGARFRGERLSWTLALFYGKLDDYILVSAPGMAEREARNIDATTYGGELDASLRLGQHWRLVATAAWVRATNDTENVPLAQTPPMDGTLGVDFDNGDWFGGALLRASARQDRIHPRHGTIYSLDSAPTPGFSVVSLYGGRHLLEQMSVTAGIDNLFDRHYAEHIQRGLAELGAAATRVPEPGRSFWLRINASF